MTKPYLIIMRKWDQKKIAYDRSYTLIPDQFVDYKSISFDYIVQIENGIQATNGYPDWLDLKTEDQWVSIWFNYYD